MIHAQPKRPVLLLPQETAEKVGGVLIARHAWSDAVGIGDICAQRYLETEPLIRRILRISYPTSDVISYSLAYTGTVFLTALPFFMVVT